MTMGILPILQDRKTCLQKYICKGIFILGKYILYLNPFSEILKQEVTASTEKIIQRCLYTLIQN